MAEGPFSHYAAAFLIVVPFPVVIATADHPQPTLGVFPLSLALDLCYRQSTSDTLKPGGVYVGSPLRRAECMANPPGAFIGQAGFCVHRSDDPLFKGYLFKG